MKRSIVLCLVLCAAGCPSTNGNGASSQQAEVMVADGEQLTTTDSGLRYRDLKVGDGATPQQGDQVEVHYTGWLLDGTKFDSSVDRNAAFLFKVGTGAVIAGWDEGVISMKVGGKRKLVIPPALGYGDRQVGSIPAGSTLVFEVELLEIR